MLNTFSCVYWPFLLKYLLSICPFLYQDGYLFIIKIRNSLYIRNTSPFLKYMCCKYFYPCLQFVYSLIFILLYFFPLPLVPLHPLPQQSPHCCPCTCVLLSFCSIPPTPAPTLGCHPATSLWMSLSPFCLLIHFVHSCVSNVSWWEEVLNFTI